MYEVRDPRGSELDAIVALGEQVGQETIYSHLSYDKDKAANVIAGAILKQKGWFIKVIVEDDKIVGGLLCWCGEETFTQDKIARDITIMLKKEHRGKCLQALVTMVEEYKKWAEEEGAKLIVLGASSGINTAGASRLFTKMGFKLTGVLHTISVGV